MQSNIQNLNKGEWMKKRKSSSTEQSLPLTEDTNELVKLYMKSCGVNVYESYTIAQSNFGDYFTSRKGSRVLRDAFSKRTKIGLRRRMSWLAPNIRAIVDNQPSREKVLSIWQLGARKHPGSLTMYLNRQGGVFFALNICSHEFELQYLQPLEFTDYRVWSNGLVLAAVKQFQTPEAVEQLFKQLLAEVGE